MGYIEGCLGRTKDKGNPAVVFNKSEYTGSQKELSEAFELIHRYRTEVPLGNQPYMIAKKAGDWLKRNANAPASP